MESARGYARNRASMSACGINIQGRSRKLYLNYRTTEEIRRLAVATLEGCEVDDLDDGSDEVKRYKSLSHGPAPKTLVFQHLEDALASLASLLKESLAEGSSVCVIVPTKHDASAVQNSLKTSNIRRMDRSNVDDIARDLRVSRDTLDELVRKGPHAADELPKLLKALGIGESELARIQPSMLRDMQRVCALCEDKGQCDRDLAAGASPGALSGILPQRIYNRGVGPIGEPIGCTRDVR